MTDFFFLKEQHLHIQKKKNITKVNRLRHCSHPGEIFVPRGYLTVSGDIFGCHNLSGVIVILWVEASNTINHPGVQDSSHLCPCPEQRIIWLKMSVC